MDIPANTASTPCILNQSFSVRLAEAKKAAIEAALKCRRECLRAADLKHRPASNTERVVNEERVSNIEAILTTEPEPGSSIQILKNHSNATDQPTDVINDSQLSLKLTKPYSQLKSARKRKRTTGIKKIDSRFSPSTAKFNMASSSQTASHSVSA